jgi:hypothetical protein
MDPRGTLLGPIGPHPFAAMEGKYERPFVNMIWYELTVGWTKFSESRRFERQDLVFAAQ